MADQGGADDWVAGPDDWTPAPDAGGAPPPPNATTTLQTTAGGAFGHGLERGAAPAVGGFGAGVATAAAAQPAILPIAAATGPFAPITEGVLTGAAGLAGGFGGGYAVGKAQDWLLKHLPESWRKGMGQDEATIRAEQEQHPYASFTGEMLPNFAMMRPGKIVQQGPKAASLAGRLFANPVTQRTLGAGLQGGIEAGQEQATTGNIDPAKVAIATGMGAVMNRPTRFGERVAEASTAPQRVLTNIAKGRPANAPPETPAPPAGGAADDWVPETNQAAPPQAAPPPGNPVGVRFKGGPPRRAEVDHYFDNGNAVRLRMDDGTFHDITTADLLKNQTEPPAPIPRPQEIEGKPPRDVAMDEAPFPDDWYEPQTGPQAAPRPSEPTLGADMLNALDHADSLERTALNGSLKLSGAARQDMLTEAARLRRLYGRAPDEGIGPESYRHPLADEPAADLGELARARVENPELYQGERRVPPPEQPASEQRPMIDPYALEDIQRARAPLHKGESIFDAIRALGGIRDDRGDVGQIMQGYKNPPFQRRVVNPEGRSPDEIREALQQQGWFGAEDRFGPGAQEAGFYPGDDVRDLYELMDREARGDKIYHPDSDTAQELASRRYLDEELDNAGVTARDKPEEAARKLADYRASRDAEQARWEAEQAAYEPMDTLPPEDLERLYQHGYEPGADIGAEHEEFAGHEEGAGGPENQPGQPGEDHGFGKPPAGVGEEPAEKYAGERQDLGNGVTAEQTLIPGSERSARQLAAAREAAGQGKMRAKAPQQEAGGLFGAKEPDQGSLFEGSPEYDRAAAGIAAAGRPGVQTNLASDLQAFLDASGAHGGEGVVAYLRARGDKTGTEALVLMDGHGGNLVDANSVNLNDRVYFSPEASAAIKDPSQNIVGLHNHPRNTSLSGADIAQMASPGMRWIGVTGHDGNFYAARVTEQTHAALSQPPTMVDGAPKQVHAERFQQALQRAYAKVSDETQWLVNRGDIPVQVANRYHSMAISLALEKAGLIDHFGSAGIPAEFSAPYKRVIDSGAHAAASYSDSVGLPRDVSRDSVSYRPPEPVEPAAGIARIFGKPEGAGPVRPGGEVRQGDNGTQPEQPRKPEQLRLLEEEREFARQTETPEFKRWFGVSKVVDAEGKPQRVYHGTVRPDRIGNRFRKSRATSGPMSFFTDDPELASSYATGKQDTSLHNEDQNYETWFKAKVGRGNPVPIDRLWYYLKPEERARIAELAPRVGRDYETGENIMLHPEGHNDGLGAYDQHIKDARGNHLKALVDEWLNSGGLFNEEDRFNQVLKLAGLDHPVQEDFPHAQYPAVMPAYLSIKKPLDTGNIPPEVVSALNKSANRQRKAPAMHGADIWAKNSRGAQEWMQTLHEGIKNPDSQHAFTSIPDWVTKTLKEFGYDGIKDVGGRVTGGKRHNVWIPFEENQVKSAVGNKGSFSPDTANILREDERRYASENPPTEKQFYSRYMQHLDSRGRESGNAAANREAIMREGFHADMVGKPGPFTTNASTIKRPGEGGSSFAKQYQPKAGDVVYFVPREGWKDTGNGPAVKFGWKPKPWEAVTVTDPSKAPYEMFREAWDAAHQGKEGVTEDERKYARQIPKNMTQAGDHLDATSDVMADTIKGQPPGTYERTLAQMAPPSGPNQFKAPNVLEKWATLFPHTMAKLDTYSGRFWNEWQARDRTTNKIMLDARNLIADKFLKLDEAGRRNVYAAEELDRIANNVRPDTGHDIVARNDGVKTARFTKPGQVVRLSTDESAAYHERRRMFAHLWSSIMEGTARRFGWTGEIGPDMDANIKAIRERAATTADRGLSRSLTHAADTLTAMEEQRRQAYVPLMRFGDYYISVTPKVGTDKSSTGGFPKTEWFELVERPASKDWTGERFKTGEVPAYAKEKIDALRQQYPADQYNIEHGHLFDRPDAFRRLDIPAVEKLLTLTEGGAMRSLYEQAKGEGLSKGAARERAQSKYDALYGQMIDQIRQEMYESLKAGFKKRARTVPGYDPDWDRVTGAYMHWTGKHAADQIHHDRIEDAYNSIQDSHPSRGAKQYWSDWRAYQDRPSDALSRAGNVASRIGFLYTLAGNVSSAVVNATDPIVSSIPTLSVGVGIKPAYKAFGAATKDATAALRADTSRGLYIQPENAGRTPAERAFLKAMDEEGLLHPMWTQDMEVLNDRQSSMWGNLKGSMRRTMDIASSMMGSTEQIKRVGLALSAYRMAQNPKTLAAMDKAWSGNQVWRAMKERQGGATPENIARFLTAEGAFEWGKQNQAPAMRGPVGQATFLLHGFQARFLSNVWNLLNNMGPEGKKALLWIAAGIWAGAGIEGLPFVKDAENIADQSWKFLTGKDPMIPYRIRALLADSGFGKVGSEIIMRGPASTVLGANLADRIGFGDILSQEFSTDTMAGIPLTVWSIASQRASAIARRLRSGQPLEAVAETLPAALRNPVLAYAQSQKGVRSQAGKVTVPAEKLSGADIAKRALGFAPETVQHAYEANDWRYRAKKSRMGAPANPIPGYKDGGRVGLHEAAHQADHEPTEAQIKAGNYRKGHITLHGFDITVETPIGAPRRGVGADGEPWENRHSTAHYGYLKRTHGADGEHVDCYVGPHHASRRIFVVNQIQPGSKRLDEHKVVLGARTLGEAKAIYDEGFSDGSGPKRRWSIKEMTPEELRAWLDKGSAKRPLVAAA